MIIWKTIWNDRKLYWNEYCIVSSAKSILCDLNFFQIRNFYNTVNSIENIAWSASGTLCGTDTVETFCWTSWTWSWWSSVFSCSTTVCLTAFIWGKSKSRWACRAIRRSVLTLWARICASSTNTVLSIIELSRWASLNR